MAVFGFGGCSQPVGDSFIMGGLVSLRLRRSMESMLVQMENHFCYCTLGHVLKFFKCPRTDGESLWLLYQLALFGLFLAVLIRLLEEVPVRSSGA